MLGICLLHHQCHSTNLIARLHAEIKRRTNIVGIIPRRSNVRHSVTKKPHRDRFPYLPIRIRNLFHANARATSQNVATQDVDATLCCTGHVELVL